MTYRVDRIAVDQDTVQEKLETFLNQMEGTLEAVVPFAVPKLQGMGAACRVAFLLIVERLGSS